MVDGWIVVFDFYRLSFYWIYFELLFLCIFPAYVCAMVHFNINIQYSRNSLANFLLLPFLHLNMQCTSPSHIHSLINPTSWKLINLISFHTFFARMQLQQLPHCLYSHTWILHGTFGPSLVFSLSSFALFFGFDFLCAGWVSWCS